MSAVPLAVQTQYEVTPDIFADAPPNNLKHGESYTMTVSATDLTFTSKGILSILIPKLVIPLTKIKSVKNYKPPFSKACMLMELEDGFEKLWVGKEPEELEAAIDKINAVCKLINGDIIVCGSLDASTGASVTFFDAAVAAKLFSSTYRQILAPVESIEKVPLGTEAEAGYVQVKRVVTGVTCSAMIPEFGEDVAARQMPCFCATLASSELVLDVTTTTNEFGTTYGLLKPGEETPTKPLSISIASQVILSAPVVPGFKLVSLPKMPEFKARSTSSDRKSVVKRLQSVTKGKPGSKSDEAAPPAADAL